MPKYLSVAVVGLLSVFQAADAQDLEKPDALSACIDDIEFAGFLETKTFQAAVDFCLSQGASLATISDEDQFDYVANLTQEMNTDCWIGAKDLGNGSNDFDRFEWLNTTVPGIDFSAYTIRGQFPWRPRQPNDANSNEDCVTFREHSESPRFGDNTCNDGGVDGFICRRACTQIPTTSPSYAPTDSPTLSPIITPTSSPTTTPTSEPTTKSTPSPTNTPTTTITSPPSVDSSGVSKNIGQSWYPFVAGGFGFLFLVTVVLLSLQLSKLKKIRREIKEADVTYRKLRKLM